MIKIRPGTGRPPSFSFLWRYTDAVTTDITERDAMMRRYQGRDVIFTFTGTTIKARDVITDLASVNQQGSSAGLQVTGISHTFYIADMKKSRPFLDMNLQEILREILPSETPQTLVRL